MGGIQTLNIGLHNLGTFRYLAVMSSGWTTEQDRDFFYKDRGGRRFRGTTRRSSCSGGGWGETDIARANGLAVIETFKSQGVRVETPEPWRAHLGQLAAVFGPGGTEVVPLGCSSSPFCSENSLHALPAGCH